MMAQFYILFHVLLMFMQSGAVIMLYSYNAICNSGHNAVAWLLIFLDSRYNFFYNYQG